MENPEMVDELSIKNILIEKMPEIDSQPRESLTSRLFEWKVYGKDMMVGAAAFIFGMIAMSFFTTDLSTDKQSMQVLTLSQVRSGSSGVFVPSLELDRDAKSNEQFVLLLDVSPERSGPYSVSVNRKNDDQQSGITAEIITS